MKTICALAGSLCALCAWAQYNQPSSVLDGSGTRAAGSTFTNLSAAGQPGGIIVSSGGSYVNHAGFLNTFFLRPGLDTDGDGLANEADLDNDADGLADTTEIAGGSFNPVTATDVNLADSDGDGTGDGQEAVAGTDPRDLNAQLELVEISRGSSTRVVWIARSNKTYRVLSATEPGRPLTNLVAEVLVNGSANPPWYVVTGAVPDVSADLTRSYAVEVLP